ncbi:MAG: UDP-N-acetylmuramoyl-tripeptide--D-alanyl-D-alanine ligase [Lachnospiraceae bacterium]|nr:UDP-N-acetylmuramoyl-tripeptide--D-alanyl-D-alanine ligase [Lachnospiraceae bacterium]
MEQMTVRMIAEAAGGRLLCGNPDAPIEHISIDSRTMKGNDLFVPLIGEKVDAHRFIGQAFQAGAKAVLTSEHEEADPSIDGDGAYAWIQVEDTKAALQSIGSWYRDRLTLPLIGVTGSVGKTTTREMIAAALSAGYRTYKTPGNSNSQVGVPITISEISSGDEIGVIELGVSEPGEMHRIAMVAKVDQAVMTNIGIAHIEQLGSQANICAEKLHIQDGMKEGGCLYVNGDDPILKHVEAKAGCRTIYYGTGANCDYQAVDIRTEEGHPVFTALCQESGEYASVRLQVFGAHMILNAMVAIAVARENGIPMAEAARALENFHGMKGRQQIQTVRGITVIDDSYNASPVSMKAGIQVLCDMPAEGRKFAVLADMKELGERTVEYHREIGSFLAERKEKLDVVALYGELAAEIGKRLEGALGGSGDFRCRVFYFQDKKQMEDWLKTELKSGDCVLFKGSNSMGLSAVAASFLDEN